MQKVMRIRLSERDTIITTQRTFSYLSIAFEALEKLSHEYELYGLSEMARHDKETIENSLRESGYYDFIDNIKKGVN